MIGWWSVAFAADRVVLADRVYPVSGPPIERGAVVVRDGKITAVGAADAIPVPPGAEVVRAAAVTPGMIDGLCSIGLTGPLNRPFDQDHLQPGDPVEPELRALDAYDPWSELVGWVRELGVTTVHVGPSAGAPVSGRTAVMSTAPGPALVPEAFVLVTLGEASKEFPGSQTRMGSVAEVRQALAAAREYRERRKLPLADRPEIDLGSEALVAALDRRARVVAVAHRADDLLAALRLREEFGLDLVLAGATEGYLVRDAIARAGVPVWVGPVMQRQWSSLGETHDGTFENASLLAAAGVTVGFMTGYEAYVPKVRVVGWEAAIAAANGLGPDAALKAVTLTNAQLLGIAEHKGSLEVGKDADLVLYDGDPFEYRTRVCGVWIGGASVTDGSCQ
ncbi:MAG: amidohydrolase family protein [Myxococcota bacterium]